MCFTTDNKVQMAIN